MAVGWVSLGIAVTQSCGAAPPQCQLTVPPHPSRSGSGNGKGRTPCPLQGCQNGGWRWDAPVKPPQRTPCAPAGAILAEGEVSSELALQLAPAPQTCPAHGSGHPRVQRLFREPGATRGRAQPEQDGTPSAHVCDTAHPSAPHTGTCLPLQQENCVSGNHPRANPGAGSHSKLGVRWGEKPPCTAYTGHGQGWVILS